MKRLARKFSNLVIGLSFLVSSVSAWAIQPADYFAGPVSNEGVPFVDCTQFDMNFWILLDWNYFEYGRVHFNQDGVPVRLNGFIQIMDGRGYNSEDGGFEFTHESAAGRGEHAHFVVRFDDFGDAIFYMETGINSRIIIPGLGPISVGIGQVRFESEDGINWYITNFTPNRDPSMTEAQMHDICQYLNHE